MKIGRTIMMFLPLFLMTATAQSQYQQPREKRKEFKSIVTQHTTIDSGIMIIQTYIGACKNYWMNAMIHPFDTVQAIASIVPSVRPPAIALLTVHGNISYDFLYRSGSEQAFLPRDLHQHREQVNLKMVYQEKYPINLSFASRQSNSMVFKRFIDLQLNFDPLVYQNMTREKLLKQVKQKFGTVPGKSAITEELERTVKRFNLLKAWLESRAVLQKLIEEKEKIVLANNEHRSLADPAMAGLTDDHVVKRSRPGIGHFQPLSPGKLKSFVQQKQLSVQDTKDNVIANMGADTQRMIDSIATSSAFFKFYVQQQKEMASLSDSIKQLQERSTIARRQIQQLQTQVIQKLNRSRSLRELKQAAKEIGIAQTNSRIEDLLAGVKIFGIGRSMVNHTELTAKNIMVSGVNIIYNSQMYVAVAAGTIDYSFRDFYQLNTSRPQGQYLILGRMGMGDIDRKAIILSVFQGRKNSSPLAFPDSVASQVPVTGYSIEAILKGTNSSLSAEIAKSTKPRLGSMSAKVGGELFRFADKTNLGINIKAQTVLVETGTRLNGFYRRTGKDFQSFSLFNYNTDQAAWMLNADQAFFKNRLHVSAALRQNDFSNPFTTRTYKTTTVFKSFLLNVRLPKYPAISAGFYPSTQIYFVDKDKMRENAYYVLNASMVHSYQLSNLTMNTTLFYNRYLSKATDSGFVQNNGINYHGMHTIFFKGFSWRSGGSWTRQSTFSFYSLESAINGSLKSFVRFGAGLKMNRVLHNSTYWAPQFSLEIDCRQIGTLSMQYDRGFYPVIDNTMLPVEFGRLSWYKTF